ncbi:MFS transporter [Rhizomonospora bruguierae]|uniref:MFS transporter n=1 Tax=Rhizomonospora bruguierae TaxID=1581705 RepID=UPI001BCAEE0C|nr:MFS transporter [Micromonospora sp. NBRC 107566]
MREVGSRRSRLLLRVAVVAAIGGFLFGYDTGVIGGALLYIRHDLHAASDLDQQAIVSSLLVGAVVGALVAGRLANRWGRRGAIIGARFVLGLSPSGTCPATGGRCWAWPASPASCSRWG